MSHLSKNQITFIFFCPRPYPDIGACYKLEIWQEEHTQKQLVTIVACCHCNQNEKLRNKVIK